jgi:N-acyl-D-aspartate/D-glutamate deacylase
VGGRDALLKRIKGPERAKVLEDVKVNIARRGGADRLVISLYAPDPSIEGRHIAELAQKAGTTPEEHALSLLERGDASLVSFNMSERDIELIMRQPWTMTSSDGGLGVMGVGRPHPRAYGAFPRKLRVYVRERTIIDWPFAIRSMTSLPAIVFGLKDRGVLRPGAWADIVIFDPLQVGDRATYENPHQLSVGIDTILVNGRIARLDGRFTPALAGKVLRPER